MSSFSSSLGQSGHDGYQSFDSQPFESNFSGNESVNEAPEEDVFTSQQAAAPIYSSGGGLSPLSPETSGNGPISPPPKEMEPEEGFALREWRRQNAIRLEEKEKSEKEILKKIVEEADEYKTESYRKWKLRCENNKHQNKEKEKLFLESREKFHAEASKTYWKAIAELIPNEVPAIEKKGKKEKEKKPSIVVIQGPKPGKQTDLTRMRQILVKLKHNAPLHMRPLPIPTPSVESGKDSRNGTSSPAAGTPAKPVSTNPSQALATA